MRWGDMRPSDNVEDRTGERSGGGGFPLGGGMRLGGGAIIVIVVVSLLFGVNPLQILGMLEGGGPVVAPQQESAPAPRVTTATTDPQKKFVALVVRSTEDVWTPIFESMGTRYEPPKLTLFSNAISSGCGPASAAAGPFYCPVDQKVYLDTAFFSELQNRFRAPGDFAQAYVIAHEIGHHVQNQLGTMQKFEQAAARTDARQRNALSIRLELQADCYAGVWGFHAAKRNILEPGDLEEGLRAASAVGDDAIQKRTQGHVVPDAFTHGTAEQRVKWFRTGFASGDPRSCNTFAANM
jgi:predicted metalloprotease